MALTHPCIEYNVALNSELIVLNSLLRFCQMLRANIIYAVFEFSWRVNEMRTH